MVILFVARSRLSFSERYQRVRFPHQGRELNITTRACFHVYDCRVAILFEIAMFSSFHRNKCSGGGPRLPGPAGRQTVLADLLIQLYHPARRYPVQTLAEWKAGAHVNTHTHANVNTDTPPARPRTPHAVSGFHVLCPNF